MQEKLLDTLPVAAASRAANGSQIPGAILSFVVGFAVVSTAIHLCIHQPLRLYAAIRSEKVRLLDQWSGRALSASFGSSHVHNGFDPRAFDDELKGTPLQTVTINLGIEGGSQGEQRAMALEFLRHLVAPSVKPESCLVLLELNAGANLTVDHLVHPRSINIYDLDTARFIFNLSGNGLGGVQQLGRDSFALSAAALHAANVGMLSSAIFSPPFDDAMSVAETKNDRRGLYNEERVSARDRLGLIKALDSRSLPPRPQPQPLLAGNYRLLRDLSVASRVSNVQFIYFVSPKLTDLAAFPDYPASLEGPSGATPIVNLARPDRYPLLYQRQYWHDVNHLNEAGASLASRILADELKLWYAKTPIVPVCGG